MDSETLIKKIQGMDTCTLNSLVELSLLLKEFPNISTSEGASCYPSERKMYNMLRNQVPSFVDDHFMRQAAYGEWELY